MYKEPLELCICVDPLLINLSGNFWTCNYCYVNLLYVRLFCVESFLTFPIYVYFIPVNVFAPNIMDIPKLLHVSCIASVKIKYSHIVGSKLALKKENA